MATTLVERKTRQVSRGHRRRGQDDAVSKLSPIDAIRIPQAFTQQQLLDAREFEGAARERGVSLWRDDLERFHRARILVPLFAIRRPRWDINRRVAIESYAELSGGRLWTVPKDGSSLVEDLDARLVKDGRSVRFRAWASELVGTPHGSIGRREYLYSHYQLLDLPVLNDATPLLRRTATKLTRWQRRQLRQLRERGARQAELVALLEALEPRYLPDIVRHYRTRVGREGEWRAYLDRFDPVALLNQAGWGTDEIYEAAGRLIHLADSVDPLRNWLDLVRQVHPDKWQRLRGDDLLAIDLRIAAEMAYRFLEDLQRAAAAPAFPEVPKRVSHELNSRIRNDRSELDGVLMAFDLSPYPAVVLALEGPTEMAIAPLVMDLLGIPRRDSFIRLVDSGSEDRDHGFLAQYVRSRRSVLARATSPRSSGRPPATSSRSTAIGALPIRQLARVSVASGRACCSTACLSNIRRTSRARRSTAWSSSRRGPTVSTSSGPTSATRRSRPASWRPVSLQRGPLQPASRPSWSTRGEARSQSILYGHGGRRSRPSRISPYCCGRSSRRESRVHLTTPSDCDRSQ